MPNIPFPIGDLLLNPPLSQLQIDPNGFVCTGQGIIPGDTGLLPSQFGMWWEFVSVPPELGYLDGMIRHYQQRMIQLRVMHTIRGVLFATDLIDADYDHVVHRWTVLLPTQIEFWVLPGVTVNVHKLIGRSGG